MEDELKWDNLPGALDMWINDVNRGGLSLGYKVEKTLFSGRSPFQQIDVVQTAALGRMLLNDGIPMLTEYDEFIYHEMIAHVPLSVHPRPRKVLVIGGGDGGTVREVLKHQSIERVVMVELDQMVVDVCREHLPSTAGALNDPRLEIRFEDGVRFAADTPERFDVAIVDSTDPAGPGKVLFEKPFYADIARLLTADGIMVTQAESPLFFADVQKVIFANQRPFFKRLHMYLYPIITYAGALYSFGLASKRLCPLGDFEPRRTAQAAIDTRYYNPGIHRAAFMLPNFVQAEFADVLDPLSWPAA